jgi:predicted phosphodiesterase
MKAFTAIGILSLLVSGCAAALIKDYQIWCVGNCDHDVVPSSTTPGAVLMGGGVSAFLYSSHQFFLT